MESLESRLVLYSASGNAWPAAQLVTISFMPDGTNVGGRTSDMQARFNQLFGSTAAWQSTILRAAQTWASYANLNFEVVADNGAGQGSGSYQQGNPNFGDIRIGGFNFGSSTLATAYMPPPVNNFSIAGDISFNTGQVFKNGQTYDLFTVAAHEIGHSLGLYHSTVAAAQEYATYNAVKNTFNADDIAGIRAIYGGARQQDSYDAAAANGTLATASDLTSQVGTTSLTGVVTDLDITSTADVDFYKFKAPAGSGSTLSVRVQSDGISLLAPSVQILNASGTIVASAVGSGQTGSTLTLTAGGITAGSTYYIKVDGADNTVFGTGAYGLAIDLGPNPIPTIPTPNTQLLNGSPLQSGGGQALVVNAESLANEFTPGAQETSAGRNSVAIDSRGNYVVTWQGEGQDGDGYGVYAQRFDASGRRVGGEFRVNSTIDGDQLNPAVAMAPGGDFVITWQSKGQDGDGYGVYAQRFDASGRRVGGEFRVNSATDGDQLNPAVAMDGDGDFVITWQSRGQDGSGWGIFAQRYSSYGFKVGWEFRVNSTTAGDQTNPAIGADSLGNVIIAWQGQDGSGLGIFAQRFLFLGLPLGGEFRVNTYTTGDQDSPSVAINSEGEWAVAWQSRGQDGSGYGVYAQRYGVLGFRDGGEFQVNNTTRGDQVSPAAAMNNAGDLLVTWVNKGGPNYTIYGRQYLATGASIDEEFVVNKTRGHDVDNPSVAINNAGIAVSVWTGANAHDKDGVLMQGYNLTSLEDRGFGARRARLFALRDLREEHRGARQAGDRDRMREIRREIARLRAELQSGRRVAGPREARVGQAVPAVRAGGATRRSGRVDGAHAFLARHDGGVRVSPEAVDALLGRGALPGIAGRLHRDW